MELTRVEELELSLAVSGNSIITKLMTKEECKALKAHCDEKGYESTVFEERGMFGLTVNK